MPQSLEHLTFLQRLKLYWFMLLRGVLHWWVKARVLPDAEGEIGVRGGGSVCYVLADYELSSVLILDRACEKQGIDRPLYPIEGLEAIEKRAYAVLKRLQGIFIRRPSSRRSSEVLRRLVEYCYAHPDRDIQLVPVTVFVGRAPDKETGFAKVLFAENWEVAGRFRRLIGTLINGRDTIVQFSRPISLREIADEQLGAARSLRKVSRILRTHFRRVKTAVIGPDLSHRRMVIGSVINAPSVRAAIADKARREGIPEEKAERIARKYAVEIAANYSYTFVRLTFFVLHWFLNKVFQGLHLHHLDRFKRQALDHEVIYVPCHRSHADYILLSYMLYTEGFVPPHVAAGVNLNMPVIGSWLRRGGAFYLRRSFRSQKLYSTVFSEYVSSILSQGVAIEYFIEGTRSRTGRLLPPKGGMLAMTVRTYMRAPLRPIMFQPVYIGYEQLLEGTSYTHELSGEGKRKETLGDLFKAFRLINRKYGEAHLSFGEPIFLDALLDERHKDWRQADDGEDARPSWLNPLVTDLGNRILRSVNAAANVNAVNLVALVMLATPKHALGERELLEQIALYRTVLEKGPYADGISITGRGDADVVEHAFGLGLLERRPHPLGDIVTVAPQHAVSLTYFRNNVAHLLAVPSLIACCFLRQRGLEKGRLERIAKDVYPFLRSELFLPWEDDAFLDVLREYLDLLASLGLMDEAPDGSRVERREGGTAEAGRMTLLARGMLPALERYYIAIAVLVKNGSGRISRQQLEQLCILTAQRISMLQEFGAPEFYDRALFQQFIAEMRKREILVSDAEGKLEFGERLDTMGEDARFILDKDIRHEIIRVAPQVLETPVD